MTALTSSMFTHAPLFIPIWHLLFLRMVTLSLYRYIWTSHFLTVLIYGVSPAVRYLSLAIERRFHTVCIVWYYLVMSCKANVDNNSYVILRLFAGRFQLCMNKNIYLVQHIQHLSSIDHKCAIHRRRLKYI
ncbi:hypothetical protein AcW1_002779 [Taiwanofungus camphoratus]|nr:hypothetical protein AcV5_009547 [Antrodia cinnamomea]KAI0943051.1 hypothetical protein AcV7_002299 [Antrodia cinnamomea]KAI0943679.1 hypothetical protein AcW1_002779 [Antrodia cinnamomea]